MQDIVLSNAGPYLSLSVPGLVERRPSLVLGDSALLSRPGGGAVYEGCIHEVIISDHSPD